MKNIKQHHLIYLCVVSLFCPKAISAQAGGVWKTVSDSFSLAEAIGQPFARTLI